MHLRRLAIPSVAFEGAMPATYAARLDSVARQPHPWWSGLLVIGAGVLVGLMLAPVLPPLACTGRQPLAVLTPLQQTQYQLLHDLAQAPTLDQRWGILAQMEKTMHTAHPQPRVQSEILLPGVGQCPMSPVAPERTVHASTNR
jgi:hypothetical protein